LIFKQEKQYGEEKENNMSYCYTVRITSNPNENYPGAFYNFVNDEWDLSPSYRIYTHDIKKAEKILQETNDTIGDIVIDRFYLEYDKVEKEKSRVPRIRCPQCGWITYDQTCVELEFCNNCDQFHKDMGIS
jgi:hypothetical protein